MLPVLLDLKFFKVYTLGIFLVLAFFWGSYLFWRNIRLTSYKEEELFDGFFVSLFGALFFGRLVYVLFHFDKFGFDWLKFLLINGYPGISLYGFIVGGFISYFLYTVPRKINFAEVSDYMTAPIFLALGIAKIGSFFSGTEVGAKTKFIVALKYANGEGARHLTPLYESILFFIGAYFAYKLMFAVRRQKFKRGFNMYYFFWFFSLVYLVLDRTKGNRLLIYGNYSFNEIVSVVILLTFSLYFLYYFRYQILKKISSVRNLSFHHGHARQNLHPKAGKETAGGEEKDTATD